MKAGESKLGSEGVLLEEDEEAIVERAKKMVWPPVPMVFAGNTRELCVAGISNPSLSRMKA